MVVHSCLPARLSRMPQFLILLLSLAFLLAPGLLPAEETKTPSRVNMAWEEFKQLLKIDAPEVQLTWDEFKRLVAQTGSEVKIDYNLENGKVVIPRDQLKTLLDQMQPPQNQNQQPPQDFLITSADYSGRMSHDSTAFQANFHIEVPQKGRKQFVKIPLLPQTVALQALAWDHQSALVMTENGWYVLITDKPGPHEVTAAFSVASPLDKGGKVLDFAIPQTAITLLTLDVPVRAAKAEIAQAKQTTVSPGETHTRIEAVLSPTTLLQVQLHRALVQEKRGPAKVYAETLNLLSFEDDALRVNTRVNLNILQNAISEIALEVPAGFNVLVVRDAANDEIRDWTTQPGKNGDILSIPLEGQKEGNLALTIMSEKILAQGKPEITFTGFRVLDAIRETGFIGAEKKSTAEAEIVKVDNSDRVDIQELPFDLISMSAKPLIFGLRYLHHPYELTLQITKHEELPTINTVIDNASIMSVVLGEGKVVTRVIYTVRNTWKQFLELKLPPESEMWSLTVDGQRELPARDKKGVFMLPLVRSQMEGEAIRPFNVEILYYTKTKAFGLAGARRLPFPTADVVISQVLWSCYLPAEYSFLSFGGNLEKEKIAEGLRPLLGLKRVFTYNDLEGYNEVLSSMKGGAKISSKRNQRLMRDLQSEFHSQSQNDNIALANQLEQEIGFAQNIKTAQTQGAGSDAKSGLALMQIEVPTTGQLYRFAKTLVEGEDLFITYSYVREWVRTVLLLLLLAAAAFGLFRKRRALLAFSAQVRYRLAMYQPLWNYLQSLSGVRWLLAGAAVVFYFLSEWLFVILAVLWLIAWFKPEWLYKSKTPKPLLSVKPSRTVKSKRAIR